jgi:hypothetical protein
VAILVVLALQALIFALFGAWMETWRPGYGFQEAGLEYLLVGAFLFFVGLGASKGGRVTGAIALLIEATYLTTLGTGTASWGGYYQVLNVPFWIALGLAVIAVPLLLASWFRKDDSLRFGLIAAAVVGVAVLLGIGWYFWVIVPNLPRVIY